MDDSLPIPEATRKRSGKYQDAARLYIHKRMTNISELARFVGLPNDVHIRRVKEQDDWDGFTAQVAGGSITSVWGALGQLDGWSPDTFARVKEERDRQVRMLPALVEERERLLQTLPSLEVGSKSHSSACAGLRAISSLLSDYTGLDRFWKALEAGSKTREHIGSSERAVRGVIVDLQAEAIPLK